jgi:hypothetical protein
MVQFLLVLLCPAVFVGWMVVRQVRKDKTPAEFCCYLLYCIGAVSIVMWCIPDAGPEGDLGKEGLKVLSWIGAGFICLGLLLHLVLWKLGRLAPRAYRKPLILVLLVVILGALVLQLLESTGLETWSKYLVFGGFIFLVFGVSARRRPANRIIRLIKH